MTIKLDSDRALENDADDQFGFVGMAQRLAPSILEASHGEGLVIGLEGPWGSGKTSLLNFLREELEKCADDNIHTISIAPWLNGDAASLVASLLNPISDVLTATEEVRAKADGVQVDDVKRKAAEVGKIVRDYSQKTARNLAPLASLAGHFFPGAQLAAGALGASADALEQYSVKAATPSELKTQIADKIRALDVGFVIILDDLDRLEPEQAVEVVRLVRSVADFPNVAYLMCYDREVLAQALKTGLKVKDGDLFLQKIVQLTFAIPLPEPFDLRTQFRNEAESIYEMVTGSKPEGDLLDDLKSAVDREGMGLSTPREVKLALNGIRFVYPSVAKEVYFPDFCRLHLIKTTQFKLYKWLEEYLSVRSIMVTGDGIITADSKKQMGKTLKKLLPSDGIGASRSIWNLRRYIPGVEVAEDPEKRVFSEITTIEARDSIALKRLGSPLHYRFYFALTGPKTVMPDAEFNKLLRLANEDVAQLRSNLLEQAQSVRQSGRTWFEHILDRLDDGTISQLDAPTASGLILAICHTMDAVIAADNRAGAFEVRVESTATRTTESLFARLKALDEAAFEDVSKSVAQSGEALNWLVGFFFRDQLWDHGKVGDRKTQPGQWVFSDEQLDEMIAVLNERLSQAENQETFANMPDLSAFLFGWRELSGQEVAATWVRKFSVNDAGFLHVLDSLRHWAMSDRVYFPLSRKSISKFFEVDDAIARLEGLAGGEHDDKVQELKMALDQAHD